MELFIILLFSFFLLACVALKLSILLALGGGLCLFLIYARQKGFSWNEIFQMSLGGIKGAKNILITFFLIGILTALWRTAGTIPVLVCYTSALFQPRLFLLMTFLVNCGVSVLTGTAFGTAATMGVICATMANSMGISLVPVGGAVLSGIYFGDRCSPVSTSALLISELTKTNLFENIRDMLKTAFIPFIISCFFYLILGFFTPYSGAQINLMSLFGQEFSLNMITLLPAALILVLSALRIHVKWAMSLSILTAIPICLLLQHVTLLDCMTFAIWGYHTTNDEIGIMLNGGGIISMLRVAAIVCLSSAYSGIFQRTGLLNQIQNKILTLEQRTTPYISMLATSVVTSLIACNQTLTIMLTYQLCKTDRTDRQTQAIQLENTAVVVAPLIPWSIAGTVPLASVGAPASGILLAVFLYILPLYQLILSFINNRKL